MNNLALKEINSARKPIENHHFVMICKVILIENMFLYSFPLKNPLPAPLVSHAFVLVY